VHKGRDPVDFECPPSEYNGRAELYWTDLLIKAGFDPSIPSCWVLEGLTYYLPSEVNQAMFTQISKLSAQGSTLVFDMVNGNFMKQGRDGWHLRDLATKGCPWKWGHNNPGGLLRALGFTAHVLDLRNLQVNRSQCVLTIHDPVEKHIEKSREALTLYVTAMRA